MSLKEAFSIKLIIFISTMLLIAIGLTFHFNHSNENNSYLSFRQLTAENFEWYSEISDGSTGVSLGLAQNFGENLEHGGYFAEFKMNTPQDPLTVMFKNLSLRERSFLLKVFYDFEEIPFRVLGEEEYSTHFYFSVNGLYELLIPFQINPSIDAVDMFSKLTIAIFTDPSGLIMDNHHLFGDGGGMALTFELRYGNEYHSDFKVQNYEPEKRLCRNEFPVDFVINQSVYPEVKMHGRSHIRATQGEKINLSYLGGINWGGNITEKYAFIALLDWNQIPINNQPFLLVDLGDENSFDTVNLGTFFIEAPSNPGFYEVIILQEIDPHRSNLDISFIPLEIWRLTLEVTE